MGAHRTIIMSGPAPSRYSESLGLADASLTMSPAHSRLCELTHRMTAVHDDFESEKKARSSVMELKCRAIDEKIMQNKRAEDERLKPLYILIERLGLDIGSERDQLQILDTKLNNDVKDLEARMAAEIEEQRQKGRIELETVFGETLEEKALIVQLEMAQEKKARQENAKHTMAGFKDAMDKLTDKLEAERDQREADEETLIKKLLADINEVHNSIKIEGTIRQESENHIIKVLEDMCQKLHAEIQAERKDRQSTEQVFMKLLDETCESIALRASSKTLAELTKKISN